MSAQHDIPIKVDKNEYKVPANANAVTGKFIRDLAGVGAAYDLWLRARGQEDDRLIRPEDSIVLEEGMHFYTAKSEITPGGCTC